MSTNIPLDKMSNDELIKITKVYRDFYDSKYISNADIELNKRGLSEKYIQLTTEIESISYECHKPLGTEYKILILFTGIFWAGFLYNYHKREGNIRRVAEISQWIIYHFILIAVVILLAGIFV